MSQYRDDTEALGERLEALKEELADAQARLEEQDALRSRSEHLEREVARLEREMSLRRGRRRLSLLDDVRVASPCDESWEAMEGDDKKRFCGVCQKNVFNLSAMTREAAEALLREADGELCIRLYRRTDGTVLTTDCPVGARRKLRNRVAFVALAATGVLLAARTFTTTQGAPAIEEPRRGSQVTMGDYAPPEADPQPPPVATVAPPRDTGILMGAMPVVPTASATPGRKGPKGR